MTAAEPRHTVRIDCSVNGERVVAEVPAHRLLLDFLRDDLHLTAAKRSCDSQVCGACTVLLDSVAVSACTCLAYEADNRRIETLEGLARGGELHPLQLAFLNENAFQCGYCTPGMIMSAVAMLREEAEPTEVEIRQYLAGNLCRCTGYEAIVRAVSWAVRHSK